MTDRYIDKRDYLPQSYLDYIEINNGWEGDLGDAFGYVVIWDKETIQDRWAEYEMSEYLSDYWFPFGSDGGGEMLCFDLRRKDDVVFIMPYVGMSDNDATRKHDTFEELSNHIKEKQINRIYVRLEKIKRGSQMRYFDLPKKCQQYLQANKDIIIDLKNKPSEIEKVVFFSPNELTSDYQIIDTYEYFLNYEEFKENPKVQYHIPAINLVKEDAEDNYESDGLLVWLPSLKCFGSFDIDHCIGYVFLNIAWSKIESNLGHFINTQWDPKSSKNILFKPWKEQGFNIDFDQYKKEI